MKHDIEIMPICHRCGDRITFCTCKKDFASPVICISEDDHRAVVDLVARLAACRRGTNTKEVEDLIEDAADWLDEMQKRGEGAGADVWSGEPYEVCDE